MYTQCPNCHQVQPLTVEQLRTSRAIAYCNHCSINFDALERLTETNPEAAPTPILLSRYATGPSSLPPWEKPPARNSRYWLAGVIAGLILLIGQGLYFEGHALAQNPQLRPKLENFCRRLHCRLPAYQNADELAVLQSALNRTSDQHYLLKAIVINQAAFKQPCPKLKLTLLDFSGKAFTYRVFQPKDYLANSATAVIGADSALDITLHIAATQTPIGGYNIELNN